MPTQANMPTSVMLTPATVSHAASVPATSANGSPAEKPRNSMAATRGSR